jgi:hypothetical protein
MPSTIRDSKELPAPYLIPRHVHLCETGNQVIFLDLRRDKYLAIGRAQRQALSGKVGGWPADNADDAPARGPQGSNEPVIRSMLKLGLLTTDSRLGKNAAHPMIESVNEALVDDDFERRITIRSAHMCRFVLACARARITLRLRSLEHAVEAVRRRKARALQRDNAFDARLNRELVAIFDRLRPFIFTAKDACLFDSLALIEFLALHGSYPTWVIGVHTQPFNAHSWVQHNELSFNGPVEFLRRFTPILAV